MVIVALCVFIAAGTLPLSTTERLVLLLVTGLILVLELLNTTVERLVDLVKPRLSTYVRDVKDMMAATVLVASLFALIVGSIILFPHLTLLLAQL
jgi:diacylglycerol kinase